MGHGADIPYPAVDRVCRIAGMADHPHTIDWFALCNQPPATPLMQLAARVQEREGRHRSTDAPKGSR